MGEHEKPAWLAGLCHLPEGGEVLLENATPTAVPPVPPARGGEVLLERETTRGQPKDGAFLLSSCGYRIMCAARACCWKMPGCPE